VPAGGGGELRGGLGGVRLAGRVVVRQWGSHLPAQSRWTDLIVLLAGTVLWGVLVKWALERAGSALPKVVAQRLGMG